MPVWSARSRSTANFRSSFERNLAVTGESGRTRNITTPHAEQRALCTVIIVYSGSTTARTTAAYPMIRNSYFHEASLPLICPIAYPSKPPPAIPRPFAEYHKPIRIGCCRLVSKGDIRITPQISYNMQLTPHRRYQHKCRIRARFCSTTEDP